MLAEYPGVLRMDDMRGRSNGPRPTAFGRFVAEVRANYGLTMEDLAERAGMSHARVSQIEKRGDIPPRDTVARLIGSAPPEGIDPIVVNRLVSEGLKVAGYLPEGGEARPRDLEAKRQMAEEIIGQFGPVEEWPEEILEAMLYTTDMDPENRDFTLKIWRNQAKEHAAMVKKRQQEQEEYLRVRQRLEDLRRQTDPD